jgi:assimilatory nitrate reductase catalytic subunit
VYEQVRTAIPEMRHERSEARHAVKWDTALDAVAQRFAEIIRRDGPDAVGIYVSGQLLTEDYYVFNKLAKGLIGTNNIDTNSRLCMSSAVMGYKQTLGVDAPPCSYEDIEQAKVIFISGSNTAYAHPVLFRRIEAARARNPDLKLIVVDPRWTDTAQSADLFLRVAPGTDVALHHGMLHIMLWEGWINRTYIDAHTEGFEALKNRVAEFTPRTVAQCCGIREEDLREAARMFAQSEATLSLYCQGLNQSTSGSANNATLINLHLATAQIGKPGAGPFSLTGQPNAMGGREVGGMANLLSAHRNLADPQDRAEVAALWDVPSVPERPGLTAIPLFDALRSGTLKAVWIVCTNPAQSLPDQAAVREALARAEFVVVQEAYRNTATVPFADVLLPATTWAEKEGTVTNSERRISRVLPATAPFGQARHDWAIAVAVGRRMEKLLGRFTRSGDTLFPYDGPESIWLEHRASTAGRDLDITGLSYDFLEIHGPQQWPMPAGAVTGKVRLYEDGVFATANGRARFVAAPYRAVAEPTDARYPFALTTGRLRDQWHGMSRTGTLARLYAHAPEPVVQISPADCARLGFQAGDLVHLTSRRGSQVLPIQPSEEVAPMQAFVAMHWGEESVAGQAGGAPGFGVNTLTLPAVDPVSGQPELKHAAIKLLKAELPWRLTAFAWLPQQKALAVQMSLREHLREFAFGSCVLFGHETQGKEEPVGVLFRVADYEAVQETTLNVIETALGLHTGDPGVLRYQDKRRGISRLIRIGAAGVLHGKLVAVLVSGETAQVAAASWLQDYLEGGASVVGLGRALLTPGKLPPGKPLTRGKVVCNCFNVSEQAITAALQGVLVEGPEQRLMALQKTLQCGTNCGSCLPELKRLVSRQSHQDTSIL